MNKFELETWVNFFVWIQSQETDVGKILGEVPYSTLLRYMQQWQTPFYLHAKRGVIGRIEIELDKGVDDKDTHRRLCQDLVLQGVLANSVVKNHRITIEWTNGQPDMLMSEVQVLPKALIDKLAEVGISIQSCTTRFTHRPIIRFRVDQIDERLVELISGWVDTIRNHTYHVGVGCWRKFTDDLGEDTDGIHYPWHQYLGMESEQIDVGSQQYLMSRVFDQNGFFRTVLIHPRWAHGAYTHP